MVRSRKPYCLEVFAAVAVLLVSAMPTAAHSRARQLADYVDPYIGSISPKTGGTSPTVLVPNGMLKVSPHFTPGIGDEYLANKIFGFPVGPLAIMATTGPISTSRDSDASGFDHGLETARVSSLFDGEQSVSGA